MTHCRLILPQWLRAKDPTLKTKEGWFTDDEIVEFNSQGYNVFYLPNHPRDYPNGVNVDGTHIDVWNCVFADCDFKGGVYADKYAFLQRLAEPDIPAPTKIVDSGNGVHVYWTVKNLDAMSFLRLQRRLCRLLNTDEAVSKLYQLMRLPDTLNTKDEHNFKMCETISESGTQYTLEDLDQALPPISVEDEAYCQTHFNKTYNINQDDTPISEELPPKFGKLLRDNTEAKELWAGNTDDRSKGDYRLGHIMFASGFSKDEALSVLVNSAKALARAPIHRRNYALNIVDKIWTYELDKSSTGLSISVLDILSRNDSEALKGRRFPCYSFFDGSEHGFRLTQVVGLCAGVGVGKTAIGLNLFKGFVEHNPDYIHMFVSLEQPAREIAHRWAKMCGDNKNLHSKVHVLSNYNDDGSYRNLSLTEIQEYILEFQKTTGLKVGCVCLDHIGVLKQENKAGEYQGLRDICAQLKSFAVATETLFVIQSQTNRDKAGIGDLELHKDAAFGTQSFESYLDFLLVAWQPLKRCYDNIACPRVTAYKFAKIRAKSKNDTLIEDQCYRLLFEQDSETLRPMTQSEVTSFDFFANLALNLRKKDRKTDLVAYVSVKPETASAQSKS